MSILEMFLLAIICNVIVDWFVEDRLHRFYASFGLFLIILSFINVFA